MTFAHAHPMRRSHANVWQVAVIALVAATVAFGAWALVARESSTSEGLASSEVATMLDSRMAAANGEDWERLADYYANDAVLEERDVIPAVVTSGRDEITARIEGLHALGLRLVSASEPIQFGPFVAQAASWGGEAYGGILVYELDADGKIAHQWVMGTG